MTHLPFRFALLLGTLSLSLSACLDIESVRERYADAGAICGDGERNGDETDVDCGGGTCEPCAVPLRCGGNDDCLSGLCLQGQCATIFCGDGVVSGTEACDSSGVPTPECNADCTLARCDDGNQNQGETDVDCGGPCATCADGRGCASGADCQSGACTESSCASASCGDGVVNGTDECDPGPGSIPTCDADCTAPSCQDGFFNAAAGEGCDDGNDIARDGCAPNCQVEQTIQYEFTGAVETYLVPPGVTRVRLFALGAKGGPDGATDPNGVGGRGGRAQGTLNVVPGDVLYIRVGEAGDAAVPAFNGGSSGTACFTGGGASDVRLNGQGLQDRVIVAGGGGAGYLGNGGGRGGGLSGTSSLVAGTCSASNVAGGGTQTSGGSRGGDSSQQSTDGALGVGGSCAGFAGGGGGGYYGGGGGGARCGGGGGASYIGGVVDASTDIGVREGHGAVTLTVLP